MIQNFSNVVNSKKSAKSLVQRVVCLFEWSQMWSDVFILNLKYMTILSLAYMSTCDNINYLLNALFISEFGSSDTLYLNENWSIPICTGCATASKFAECYICLHQISLAFREKGKSLVYCLMWYSMGLGQRFRAFKLVYLFKTSFLNYACA